jgi:hypothetical protein
MYIKWARKSAAISSSETDPQKLAERKRRDYAPVFSFYVAVRISKLTDNVDGIGSSTGAQRGLLDM